MRRASVYFALAKGIRRIYITCRRERPDEGLGKQDGSGPGDNEDLIMEDRVATSCWGWTLWALAFFGIAMAFIYLLGGFDIAPVVVR